jgi:hypothetical protein
MNGNQLIKAEQRAQQPREQEERRIGLREEWKKPEIIREK